MLDPHVRDLAKGPNYGTVSVYLPSGRIATHIVWVDADDEHVLINTEVHRTKYKAMVANPNVTVLIWEMGNPNHYVEVRGRFTGEVRGPEALASINGLSQKYTGHPYANPITSERVLVQITPERQREWPSR